MNPSVSLASELNKNHEFRIIFLSNANYKDQIEKSGSEYIEYACPDFDKMLTQTNENHSPLNTFKTMIKVSFDILPQLIAICQEHKPEAVVYDPLPGIFCKYFINYVEINKNSNSLTFPEPKFIRLATTFAFKLGIFPSKEEMMSQMAKNKMDPSQMQAIAKDQSELNQKFGLNYEFSMAKLFDVSEGLNICTVLEELQPKSAELKEFYHFVGPCVSNEVRSANVTNEKLQKLLDSFQPVNPDFDGLRQQNKQKLLFVSLGTVKLLLFYTN
jgi:UDP:flavonoid glycosyltransferase YjiC (YdhE family)